MANIATLTEPFTWYKYSKKLAARIDNPRCAGSFEETTSQARGMRLVVGDAGAIEDGNFLRLHWLLDRDDGVIVDARFTAFGQTPLLGAADVVCELCVGKNYDQARRLTVEIIDKQVRDKSDIPAFPPETKPHLQLALDAVLDAADQCTDLPLSSSYVAMPLPVGMTAPEGNGYPGWELLPLQQKIAVVEKVLDEDVRPYIALDAGGVQIMNLTPDHRLLIGYSGSCTSCYASIGTTLSYIQQVIRAKVHPDIVVVPDL